MDQIRKDTARINEETEEIRARNEKRLMELRAEETRLLKESAELDVEIKESFNKIKKLFPADN